MMKINGATELARMQAFQRRANAVEKQLETAGKELTTGLQSDLQKATGGNLGKLHAIERSLSRNAAYEQNIASVDLRLTAAVDALSRIQKPFGELAIDMVSKTGIHDHGSSMTLADTARAEFVNTVSSLNATANGQTLFSGAAIDSAALENGEVILAELDTLVAGETTAAGVIAAIEGYFAKAPAPGDFYTNGYLGADQDAGAVEVSENGRLRYSARADDDEIVGVLKALALSAVIGGGALAGDNEEQLEALAESGAQMIEAREGLLDYTNALGLQQEFVESSKARNQAEVETLEMARVNMISADPTDAATAFQALELQLQTVYTVTSRLSELNFLNYLR